MWQLLKQITFEEFHLTSSLPRVMMVYQLTDSRWLLLKLNSVHHHGFTGCQHEVDSSFVSPQLPLLVPLTKPTQLLNNEHASGEVIKFYAHTFHGILMMDILGAETVGRDYGPGEVSSRNCQLNSLFMFSRFINPVCVLRALPPHRHRRRFGSCANTVSQIN